MTFESTGPRGKVCVLVTDYIIWSLVGMHL